MHIQLPGSYFPLMGEDLPSESETTTSSDAIITEKLPPEVMMKIFSYLPMRDLVACQRVSKAFYTLASSDMLQETLVRNFERRISALSKEELAENFDERLNEFKQIILFEKSAIALRNTLWQLRLKLESNLISRKIVVWNKFRSLTKKTIRNVLSAVALPLLTYPEALFGYRDRSLLNTEEKVWLYIHVWALALFGFLLIKALPSIIDKTLGTKFCYPKPVLRQDAELKGITQILMTKESH